MKLHVYTKRERNRAMQGEIIAISVFDLMTLNNNKRVTCCARFWDSFQFFTNFGLRQCTNYSVFMLLSYVTL